MNRLASQKHTNKTSYAVTMRKTVLHPVMPQSHPHSPSPAAQVGGRSTSRFPNGEFICVITLVFRLTPRIKLTANALDDTPTDTVSSDRQTRSSAR